MRRHGFAFSEAVLQQLKCITAQVIVELTNGVTKELPVPRL
jgi:hypothetical protein